MRSIFDVQMERWLISNQHRLAYKRCRALVFTHARRIERTARTIIFGNGFDENENPKGVKS